MRAGAALQRFEVGCISTGPERNQTIVKPIHLDVARQFDARGQAKTTDLDLYRVTPVDCDSLDEPSGPAWVVDAQPRPGFQPTSRYARIFAKMAGKLWIDQHDIQWVKSDAVVIDNVYFGYFIARLAKGSRITLEQTKLADGDWVPRHIEARAEARTFLFFDHNFEEDITYSDYHTASATRYALQ